MVAFLVLGLGALALLPYYLVLVVLLLGTGAEPVHEQKTLLLSQLLTLLGAGASLAEDRGRVDGDRSQFLAIAILRDCTQSSVHVKVVRCGRQQAVSANGLLSCEICRFTACLSAISV